MLTVRRLETSLAVMINGRTISLSETDINNAFWHTADLYDTDHRGPALIPLGTETAFLKEPEWQALYAATESYIQDAIEDFEHLTRTLH